LDYKLFEDLCNDVIALDSSLRFAGIADEDGRLLASSFRPGLQPLLSSEERAQYAITAATRQFTRLRWEYLLGKIVYACSHYAKLIRATIPITDNAGRLSYVLLISMDKRTANFHEIIMKKVVPLVSKNTSRLLKEAHA
jgi:hypothetical protein